MRSLPDARRMLTTLVVGGVAAGVVAACSGVVLADVYEPDGGGVPFAALSSNVRGSSSWGDTHAIASGLLLVISVGLAAGLVWLARSGRLAGRRRALALMCGATAVSAAVLTWLTKGMVEWDQLALWSVTVGSDLSGYWFAGFGDDVRFIVVDGTEVSQSTYVAALLAHLAAPMVAVAARLLIGAIVSRSRGPEPGAR